MPSIDADGKLHSSRHHGALPLGQLRKARARLKSLEGPIIPFFAWVTFFIASARGAVRAYPATEAARTREMEVQAER